MRNTAKGNKYELSVVLGFGGRVGDRMSGAEMFEGLKKKK